MAAHPAPERALIAIAALLFAGSAAVTVAWCTSMAGMPAMDMPGGWRMSMTWMRMPGQSWLGAAAAFLGMWSVMMPAMMLPAITPALRDYRRAAAGPHANPHTARVAAAYFGVWLAAGVAIYPLGLAFAAAAMQVSALAHLAPVLAALALLAAGILQLSPWKKRQLDCCREPLARRPATGASGAWRHGLWLGWRCFICCAPLTAALLVVGVMDLGAMAAAAAAIAAERLAPRGARFARLAGVILVVAALVPLLR